MPDYCDATHLSINAGIAGNGFNGLVHRGDPVRRENLLRRFDVLCYFPRCLAPPPHWPVGPGTASVLDGITDSECERLVISGPGESDSDYKGAVIPAEQQAASQFVR